MTGDTGRRNHKRGSFCLNTAVGVNFVGKIYACHGDLVGGLKRREEARRETEKNVELIKNKKENVRNPLV